jgi:hypothetical protein
LVQQPNLNRAPRVNVRIDIGTRIPRTLRLAPLPAAIVAIAPAYRSYSHVVVEDEIVIVEPATYEVVEVIELRETGRDRDRHRARDEVRIELAPAERRIIVEVIEVDPTPKLAFGPILVGAPVPAGIDLRPLPIVVVRSIPRLERYRYFSAGRQIAIVAPEQPRIVAVVDVER